MLHGRARECAAIDRLLVQARQLRSGALVVRGDAGIGKSALLTYAAERAGGMRVLRSVGIEAEVELPYAALHQLLLPILGHASALPGVQAAALRGALGFDDGQPDRFRVCLAAFSLLAEAAEEQPVLCLLDDAQWMDAASADALVFSARRLEREGIAMLFAARDEDQHTFGAAGLAELRLTGLAPDAAALVLSSYASASPAPAVRDRLLRLTDGNPLALLELPTALTEAQLAARDPLPDPMPLSAALVQAYLGRVRRLPDDTQALLLLAAAEELGAAGTVLAAASVLGYHATALDDAERAGLLRIDGDRLEFRHPLLRSAVYAAATPAQRRSAHRAMAEVLAEPADQDRRARHRAAAAFGPDDDVAADLERSADRARRRSGYAAAAAALERAAALTSDPGSRARRMVAAADAAWIAGRPDRVPLLLDQVDQLTDDVRLRADAARLRGVIERHRGPMTRGYEILMRGAAEVAGIDPERAAQLYCDAGMAAFQSNDAGRVLEACRHLDAVASPEPLDQPSCLLRGLAGVLSADPDHGAGWFTRVIQIARELDQPYELSIATTAAIFLGQDAEALALSTRADGQARALGAVALLASILGHHAALHAWTGRYSSAIAAASEGIRLAVDTGQKYGAFDRAVVAWVLAVRGDADQAFQTAAVAVADALDHEFAAAAAIATWAEGLAELGAGHVDQALSLLVQVATPGSRRGHPIIAFQAVGDLVEAAIRAGRPEPAEDAVRRTESWVRATGSPWGAATLARCRAQLATDDSWDELFRAALERPAGTDRPLERARTCLAYGERLRRSRRRVDARVQLRTACTEFDRLGALPWLSRAQAELRATGETVSRRDPRTVERLTPQELQIVRIVSAGATNREAAAQLFLSPRTVDYHLRKVFVKLGISGRAQLAQLGIDDG